MLFNIFVEIVYALFSWFFGFRISKEHNLYKIEMFWIEFKLFTVTIDTFKNHPCWIKALISLKCSWFLTFLELYLMLFCKNKPFDICKNVEVHLKRDVEREIKNRLNEFSSALRIWVRGLSQGSDTVTGKQTEPESDGSGWITDRGCLKINLVPFSGVSEEEVF